MSRLDEIKNRVGEGRRSLDYANALAADTQERLTTSRDELGQWLDAQKVLQEAAVAVQTAAHEQIAGVVTRCLEAVFGEDAYTFHFDFDRKRGRTEATPYFLRGGMRVDPVEASGLGVVDVASFALRLACLKLIRPPVAQVLLLDEPFRFLDKRRRPKVSFLLETIASEMGVQLIVATHDETMMIGNVIDLSR